MSLPRVLLVALIALLLMVAALWAMDVNYAAWLGAWLTPTSQYSAGFAVLLVLGLTLAYFYAHYIGDKLPGPGVVRGIAFGAVLGAFAIWALPLILSGIAGAVGNAQIVFQGAARTDQSQFTQVEPCPRIGGIEPPLRFMTQDHQWAPADAWRGRVLPLGVAFLMWGAVIGAFLSEEKKS